MDESMVIEVDEKKIDKDFLKIVSGWKHDSEEAMKSTHVQWAENTNKVNGVFPQDEQARSKVRNRSKLFFRKIWATSWRILATLFQVFLKEDSVVIEGRMGTDNDVPRGKVLTEMVKYRMDKMNRKGELFTKFLWAFLDILYLGNAVGKMRWVKTETKDEPDFIVYPPEKCFPDPYAVFEEDMRYIILETDNLTMDDLREAGYKNLEDVRPSAVSDNIVAHAREAQRGGLIKPPLSVDSNYYPPDGSGDKGGAYAYGNKYRAWEIFFKNEGKIWYAVTNEGHTILEDPHELPLELYTVIIGSCLLKPHSLLGEGFSQPMAAMQDSSNDTINKRKDAVALALAPHRFVSRFAGVDLQSLTNARVGGVTMADDINGVKTEEIRDVTQKAYLEVDADDLMMQEVSGITAQREGIISNSGEKATVANIRYQESGTKLDLYVNIISQTFFKKFVYLLAYMIQKFETDETIFRIANAKLREENPKHQDIYTIDSFEADFIVKVGVDVLSKNTQVQSAMMAMDRATAANAAIFQLVQIGAIPPEQMEIFSVNKFMEDILPLMGFKNVKDYILKLQPPTNPQGAVMGTGSAPRTTAPQIGGVMNG